MAETVFGVIPNARIKTGLLKSERWVLVVTDQRLLAAHVTDELARSIREQARNQASVSGSGFLGQWGAQLKAGFAVGQRYCVMTPEAILAETPGNWALSPAQVSSIKVERKSRNAGSDDLDIESLRITTEAAGGKGPYDTDGLKPGQQEVRALLARTFGPAVR